MGFPGGLVVKKPPVHVRHSGDTGSIPGSGRSPGGGNDNPYSILAWRIAWPEEPGRLKPMWLQGVRPDRGTKQAHTHIAGYNSVVMVSGVQQSGSANWFSRTPTWIHSPPNSPPIQPATHSLTFARVLGPG